MTIGNAPADFRVLGDDRYELHAPDISTRFEVDRLRRERNQLHAELLVRCELAGARVVDGDVLTVSEINLSSQRSRQGLAAYLAQRARTNGEVDWPGLIEELSQRVLTAERRGTPSVDLRSVPRPDPDDMLDVDGLQLPRRHPSIIFGDGGAIKSYLALHYISRLAFDGLRVGLFDWELVAGDHRDRLERIHGEQMPHIEYARCERPMVSEVDRLRRIVRDKKLEFAVFDSVAFACDGPPEGAEIAGKYFRAVRQLGELGTLHIAHVSKAEGADQKPFGSAFWHNGARSTWYAKRTEATADGRTVQLGLFNRKANLGPLRPAVGFELDFSDGATRFERVDLADVPDLAATLSVRQRMALSLRSGAMTIEALAKEIGAKTDTVAREARRHRKQFVLLDGGFVGAAERGIG